MNVDLDSNDSTLHEKKYRSTRLVCAKLYEGGLFSTHEILNSIKKSPLRGKNSEFELDIDTICAHAEAAFMHHMQYTLIAIVLSLIALVFDIYNPRLSLIFSIPTICLLSLKPVWDRSIAFKHFSKENFDEYYNSYKLSDGSKVFLKTFCDYLTRSNIKPEKDEVNTQNAVIFRDYSPFLGAGKRIRSWNFVTDLSKPKKRLDSLVESQNNQEKGNTSELSLRELYEVVYKRINTKNLPNLSYKFILSADGNKEEEANFLLKDKKKQPRTYLEDLDLFTSQLGNRSRASIQPENIESFFKICEEGVFKDYRTYFNISHHDKNRSTLLSTFLRFSKIENELFTECSFYVLTPIDENVYNIDKLPRDNSFFTIKSTLVAASLIVIYVLFSYSIIPAFILFTLSVHPLVKIFNNRAKEREYNEGGGPHKYGLLKTFRETIAISDYKKYFNSKDTILIQSSIEKSILSAVTDLLDSKEIDTSFIRNELVKFIDEKILHKVLEAVPENGVFDISDASGITLYAPSRVSMAIEELIQRGAIACVNGKGQYTGTDATYRLTNEGIQLKKGIVKEKQSRLNKYKI